MINEFTQRVLKYICRLTCYTRMHTKKNTFICRKGCGEFCLCAQCAKHSYYMQFAYINRPLNRCFCLSHYISNNKILIHYWKGDTISIYDIKTQSKQDIHLSQAINAYADSISFEGRIFIMGDDTFSKLVFEANIKSKCLIKKANMLLGKFGHSLCIAKGNILSIGGYYKSSLSDCQSYYVAQDKWVNIPNLILARTLCSSFLFNYKLMYALCGSNGNGKRYNSIEKIDVDQSKQWESVECFPPFMRDSMGAIQIRPSKVLVFGGDSGISESYIIEMSGTLEFSECCNLEKSAFFSWTTAPVCYEGSVYGVDGDRSIHIYSIKDNKWRIVSNSI